MTVPTHLVHGATPLQSHPSSPRTPSTHWIPASVLTHLSLPQSSPVRWPPDSQRPPYSNQIPGTDSGCPRGPGHLVRSAEGCYRGFWDDPGGARSGGMKSHPYFKTALCKGRSMGPPFPQRTAMIRTCSGIKSVLSGILLLWLSRNIIVVPRNHIL